MCPFKTELFQVLKQDDIDTSDLNFPSVSLIPSISLKGIRATKKMSLVSECVKRFDDTSLNKCNFSIDHILNVAGEKQAEENLSDLHTDLDDKRFEWLNCTRYKPPKLPRNRKKEGIQRRKLGRNPRIPFSSSQVAFLEAKFLRTPYLSSSDVTQLANYLQLSETRVKIWFQNRRARERRDRENKSKTGEEPSKDLSSLSIQHRVSVDLREIPLNESDNTKGIPINYYQSFRYLSRDEQHCMAFMMPLDLSERHVTC